MASPFKIFRKNQKLMLAILTIVAMGGFVVLPTVLQIMSGGGTAAARREVVTTKRYGNVDLRSMSYLRQDRQTVRGLLSRIENLVRMKQQNWRGQTVAQSLLARLSPEDRGIVETWLLVKRSEELGLVVDDVAVNAFLTQLLENAVSQEELSGVLKEMGLSETQLFRLLKYELMAMRLQDLVFTSLLPITPGERWDYYQRLQRQTTVELAEVPVDRLIGGIAEPTDKVLDTFFERYKAREHLPGSTEPGFMVPKQIAIEYFKVDYEHLFTDEELKKYYDEHKEEFKREKLPEAEKKPSTPELKGGLPGVDDKSLDLGPGPKEEKPAQPPAAQGMEAGKPASDAKAAQPAKTQPENQPADAGKDMPAGKPADDNASKKQSTGEPAPKPEPKTESRAAQRPLFQLTAYQQNQEKPAPVAETVKEAPAPAAKPAEAAKETPAPAAKPAEPAKEAPAPAAKPAEGAKEKPAPAAKPAEPAKEAPAPAAKPAEAAKETPAPAAKPAEPAKEAPAPAAKPAEAAKETPAAATSQLPEYYSFEEVKSQIQSKLAPDKIEQIFRPLENQMAIYHDAHVRYIQSQDASGKATIAEPARPDFAKLAASAGIEAKTTKLMSQLQARDLDIGRSTISSGSQSLPFLSYAFESLATLRAARSQDMEGNYYLFWKTDQTDQRVPELKDPGVRQMVVDAWKRIEARGNAMQEAERLAAMARAKKAPLAESLSGEKELTVRTTEPFTWIDRTSISLALYGYGTPRLSEVTLVPKTGAAADKAKNEDSARAETLPLVGNDFMQTVAGLEPGEVGVAWNEPKTVVYVIRVIETSPPADDLRQMFLTSANPQQIGMVAMLDRRDAYQDWLTGLETMAGLEWQQ